MKLETGVMLTKGWCLVMMTVCSGLATGLVAADLVTVLGEPVKLWVVLLTTCGAGHSTLLAFLSTSFSSYLAAHPTTP